MAERIQVGFIGLGQMGGAMAERLLRSEVALHIFDPAAAAAARLTGLGATGHRSPASVADAADVVLACLPNPAASEAVALGSDGIARGHAVRTYVEMSTIGRGSVERIAAGLAGQGIGFLDAPVSGGPGGARAGTLAIMASGSAENLLRAEPVLGRIGRSIYRVGDRPGLGQAMKLVNNLVVAANMASAFEALVIGAKAGLDADTMVQVLNASTGRSFVSTDMVPRSVLTGCFDFGATIAVMEKDVTLGLAEAADLSVPLQALEQSARLWRLAMMQGRASDDITELIRMLEESAGVVVRSAGTPAQASDG